MKILFAREVIELSAKEAREAENYGSPAYLALMDAKSQFPTFSVGTKTKKKNAGAFKGMNREFMKKHIKANPKEGRDLMAEFNELCGFDADGNKKPFAAVASVGELRMWFLNEYPEFIESRSRIDKILEKTRKDIADKQAA